MKYFYAAAHLRVNGVGVGSAVVLEVRRAGVPAPPTHKVT